MKKTNIEGMVYMCLTLERKKEIEQKAEKFRQGMDNEIIDTIVLARAKGFEVSSVTFREENVKEEINNNQDTTNSKKDEDTNDKINFKQNIISDIDNKVNEEENDKTEEKQVKETIENAITLYRSNGEILNLTINEYLIGAVAGEI